MNTITTHAFNPDGSPDQGNWWQVNILNAYGRPPNSATVITGSGLVSHTG